MTEAQNLEPSREFATGAFTLDEISDYLDAGCQPRNEKLEADPEAAHALAQLRRLRGITGQLASQEEQPQQQDGWWQKIVDGISAEVAAGREIPVPAKNPSVELAITEGAVKALIRDAADTVTSCIVTKIVFSDSVTVIGDPVTVTLNVSATKETVTSGTAIATAAEELREAVLQALQTHTVLNIAAIDIQITDVEGGL